MAFFFLQKNRIAVNSTSTAECNAVMSIMENSLYLIRIRAYYILFPRSAFANCPISHANNCDWHPHLVLYLWHHDRNEGEVHTPQVWVGADQMVNSLLSPSDQGEGWDNVASHVLEEDACIQIFHRLDTQSLHSMLTVIEAEMVGNGLLSVLEEQRTG